jgi:hypothetical protein
MIRHIGVSVVVQQQQHPLGRPFSMPRAECERVFVTILDLRAIFYCEMGQGDIGQSREGEKRGREGARRRFRSSSSSLKAAKTRVSGVGIFLAIVGLHVAHIQQKEAEEETGRETPATLKKELV